MDQASLAQPINKIYLYADGSCDKEGFGGFAWALTSGITEAHRLFADENGAREDTTISRMELQGVISGLKACQMLYRPKYSIGYRYDENNPHTLIEVRSDSAYVINCFNQRWYRAWVTNNWMGTAGPVKNVDLWKELLYLANAMTGEGFQFEWIHVRGHQGNYWNERCDKLAGGARVHRKVERTGIAPKKSKPAIAPRIVGLFDVIPMAAGSEGE